MTDPFACTQCPHPIRRHTVKKWPQIALACSECDCNAYTPQWRRGTK